MKYEFAPDIQNIAEDVIKHLFPFINAGRVKCYRSYGSKAKGTIARCHALGKLMQKALGVQPFYPLEFISEQFDSLDNEDKIETIIHELMHIPKCFGGGFRHHNYVNEKNVEKCVKLYKMKKSKEHSKDFIQGINFQEEKDKGIDKGRRKKDSSKNKPKNNMLSKWFS
ncbi:metallopeptidase [Candidatus Pacearchaeota archaeon]|nr:metallopeptidase [Candidatus Pacearchaeota archaeon]